MRDCRANEGRVVSIGQDTHGDDQSRHVHSPVVLHAVSVSDIFDYYRHTVVRHTTSGGVGLSSGALAKPPMVDEAQRETSRIGAEMVADAMLILKSGV